MGAQHWPFSSLSLSPSFLISLERYIVLYHVGAKRCGTNIFYFRFIYFILPLYKLNLYLSLSLYSFLFFPFPILHFISAYCELHLTTHIFIYSFFTFTSSRPNLQLFRSLDLESSAIILFQPEYFAGK